MPQGSQRPGIDTVTQPCSCEERAQITGRVGGACPNV